MSIAIKRVGKKSYAYLVNREGRRVVHKYLGPADDPEVKKLKSAWEETNTVPERFRALFWDTDIGNIRPKKNARYVIERVLDIGDLDAVRWLQRVYTVQDVLEVLATSRAVSEKSRRFWTLWFGERDA